MTTPPAGAGAAAPRPCRFYHGHKTILYKTKKVRCTCDHCQFFREKKLEMQNKNKQNAAILEKSTIVFICQVCCAVLGAAETVFFRLYPPHQTLNLVLGLVCYVVMLAGHLYLKKSVRPTKNVNQVDILLHNFKEIQKYTRMVGSKMGHPEDEILKNESFNHSYEMIFLLDKQYLQVLDDASRDMIVRRQEALTALTNRLRAPRHPPLEGAIGGKEAMTLMLALAPDDD